MDEIVKRRVQIVCNEPSIERKKKKCSTEFNQILFRKQLEKKNLNSPLQGASRIRRSSIEAKEFVQSIWN